MAPAALGGMTGGASRGGGAVGPGWHWWAWAARMRPGQCSQPVGCCGQPRRGCCQPEGGGTARSTRGSGGQPGAAWSRASRTVRSVQEWRAALAARGLRA